MKEKKIIVSVNEEDMQNLINCYEKDIEYIKKLEKENEELKEKIKLQKRIDKAIEYIHSTEYQYGDLEQDVYDYNIDFDEVEELLKILKGE